MAALRGIVSFVVILFCMDPFCVAESDSQDLISVPESEHFCAKVMSGRFEHIQLESIRPDAIFEGSDRMLPVDRCDYFSMTLNTDTYRAVEKRDRLATNETELTLLPENDTSTGYGIRKDDHTGNFIIYDFVYKGNGSDSSVSVNPKESIPNDAFYFMEKTNNRFEFRLLHQANGSSSGDRQLLRGALPPSGFLHAGLVYLFDGSMGCVHVLDQFNLTQLFEAGKVDIRAGRLGIPYELYFKCPEKYILACDFAKRHRADRCYSVIGDDDGSSHDNAGWLFLALVVCLILAALVVGNWCLTPEKVEMSFEMDNQLIWSKTLTTSGTTSSGTPTFYEVSSSEDATAAQSNTSK